MSDIFPLNLRGRALSTILLIGVLYIISPALLGHLKAFRLPVSPKARHDLVVSQDCTEIVYRALTPYRHKSACLGKDRREGGNVRFLFLWKRGNREKQVEHSQILPFIYVNGNLRQWWYCYRAVIAPQ